MTRAIAAAVLMLSLAGCSGSPARFGITGPTGNAQRATVAPSPDDPPTNGAPETTPVGGLPADSLIQPGIPENTGETYAPSTRPTFGRNGRFYGYD